MPALVPGRPGAARDEGQVTAEAAVVLPVLLVVLAAALWVLASVSAQLSCVDAARAGARAAARGDAAGQVRTAALAVAPAGARIAVTLHGDEVVVRVDAEVHPFGPALRRLPATPVSARASAHVEAAADDPAGPAGPG